MTKPPKAIADLTIQSWTKPGRYRVTDTTGLYLYVLGPKSRSWMLRYTLNGKAREMGLGSYPATGLALAKDLCSEARTLIETGIDPLAQRADERAKAKVLEARRISFEAAATEYIEGNKAGCSNAKHGKQWTATLKA